MGKPPSDSGGEAMESVFGSATVRTRGRHTVSIDYDREMQMAYIAIVDGPVELVVWVPTHKLAGLLQDAFAAASEDPNSIGFDTWKAGDTGHSSVKMYV